MCRNSYLHPTEPNPDARSGRSGIFAMDNCIGPKSPIGYSQDESPMLCIGDSRLMSSRNLLHRAHVETSCLRGERYWKDIFQAHVDHEDCPTHLTMRW